MSQVLDAALEKDPSDIPIAFGAKAKELAAYGPNA